MITAIHIALKPTPIPHLCSISLETHRIGRDSLDLDSKRNLNGKYYFFMEKP